MIFILENVKNKLKNTGILHDNFFGADKLFLSTGGNVPLVFQCYQTHLTYDVCISDLFVFLDAFISPER